MTIQTVTLYCPEYYIDAINKNTVVRHILITRRNLTGLKPNRRDDASLLNVRCTELIWQEYFRMVLLLVDVYSCRLNRYKPWKWTFFRILFQNRVHNIIQCHDNNIWKQICTKILCYSNETYLQYNVQR